MFIATANMLETIPSPLLDRLEVLQLPGYSEEEKTHIAQKYIIPKQLDLHGLRPCDLSITDAAIRKIIADYTREAGLRNLEREIASICRKSARRRAEGRREADHDRTERHRRSARPVAFLPRAGRPHRHPRCLDRAGLDARPAARSSSSRRPACPARGA